MNARIGLPGTRYGLDHAEEPFGLHDRVIEREVEQPDNGIGAKACTA
jgi:hypothetical protein